MFLHHTHTHTNTHANRLCVVRSATFNICLIDGNMLTQLSEVSQGGSPLSWRQDYILVKKNYNQNEQLHFLNVNANSFFIKYICLLASYSSSLVNCESEPPSLKWPVTCAFQMLFKKCDLMSTAIFWSCQAGVERGLPQYLYSASVVCSLPIRHRPISRALFLLWSVLMYADLR